MHLSEAIRLGAMLRPQAFGELRGHRRWWWPFGSRAEGTCALGAAFEAGNIGTRMDSSSGAFRGNDQAARGLVWDTPETWTLLLHKAAHCPVCGTLDRLYRIIPHLNDAHRWTREAVADFVAELEQAHETTYGLPSELETLV